MDSVYLIKHEGAAVDYPQGQSCCEKLAYTFGYTDQTREVACSQLPLFAEDYPMVMPSSSCAGMLRKLCEDLFKDKAFSVRMPDIFGAMVAGKTRSLFKIGTCRVLTAD